MTRFDQIELATYPNLKFIRHIFSLIFDSIQFDFELIRIKFESFTVTNFNIMKIYNKNKKN
jgi:hypothetical protein